MTQGTKDKVRLLTKEEQLELATLIQASVKAQEELATCDPDSDRYDELQDIITTGTEAAEKLVEANLGLVYVGAQKHKRMYPRGPEFEDVVQDGMTGLMKAVYKYDPTMGNRFSTVAHYWIRQAITRGNNKTSRLVRLPENRIYDYSKMLAITSDPANAHLTAREMDEKIMKDLKISKDYLSDIRQAAAQPASLNRVVHADAGGKQELADFIPSLQQVPSPESIVLESDTSRILYSAIDKLPPVHRDVVTAAFNLGTEDFTPSAVRQKHNIREVKYRTIQKEAIERLRNELQSEGMSLSDFLNQ